MQVITHRQSSLVSRSEWLSDMQMVNMKIDTKRVNADYILRYPTPDDLSTAVDIVEEGGKFPDFIAETIGKSAVWEYLIHDELTKEDLEEASILILKDEYIYQFVVENLKNKKIEAELITDQLEIFNQRFLQGIDDGIKLGYLPEDMKKSNTLDTLDKTPIFLYDGIDYGEYHTLGQYSPGLNQIEMLKSYEFDSDLYERILVHERLHAVSGGTYRSDTDELSSFRTRTGFSQDLHPDKNDNIAATNVALNEAITEHLTRAIIEGEWEALNPLDRGNYIHDYSYLTERILLDDLIKKSYGIIDLRTITKAYFEDTETGAELKHRRAMIREFRTAYEDGTLRKFQKLCELNNRSTSCADSEFKKMIHTPTLDENGNVIKKGYIKLTTPKGFND